MRKSKQERITELRNLLGLDPEDIESEEAKRIQELTEEEVVGEIYLLKKYGPKKEENDDEMTLYCNLM
jgi:hypothetical protein